MAIFRFLKLKKTKFSTGFSLIEIIVVVGIFAVIATVASQSTIFSLKGSRKSDASGEVRDNLSFAMSIVERQLRNAQSIETACDGSTEHLKLDYVDQDKNLAYFECRNQFGSGVNGYLASNSATTRLTSENISLVDCSFVCSPSSAVGLPPIIDVSLTGRQKGGPADEDSPITLETSVLIRAY